MEGRGQREKREAGEDAVTTVQVEDGDGLDKSMEGTGTGTYFGSRVHRTL